MKKIFWPVFFLELFFLASSYAQHEVCKGIFSLWNVDQDIQEITDIEKPFVQGASIRFSWEKLEPVQGQFQWSILDAALAKAYYANKKAMLRVTAGSRSPQWVYQACAYLTINEEEVSQTLSPARLKMFNALKGKKVPVPWDETYLGLWQNFIINLGQRYNSDKRIVLIQMSGGGFAGEMFLGKEINWAKHGYDPQKIESTWKRIIDFYVTAFPDKSLALDIGAPLRADYPVMNSVIDYCLAKYPGKVFIQYNGLEGRSAQNSEYDFAIAAASANTTVGYQMTGGKSWFPERMGSYTAAFEKALRNKASYFEIYRSDILASDLQDELIRLGQQFKD